MLCVCVCAGVCKCVCVCVCVCVSSWPEWLVSSIELKPVPSRWCF